MKGLRLLLFCMAFFACLECAADEVTLKNGDRLSGSVLKLDGGKLSFKTDYAGTIQIDWNKVEQLHTEAEVVVNAKSAGKITTTDVRLSEGELLATRATAEPVVVPASDLISLRSEAEERAYEASMHPGLLQGWTGDLTLGFALARGNSETTNLSTGLIGARQSPNDKLSFYGNSVYATDRLLSAVTANAIRGGLRYDRNFNSFWFGYSSADFEFDGLQGLDLRAISGGGMGVHAIKSTKATLNLLTGTAWTREEYTFDPQRDFLVGQFGEEFTSAFGPRTSLRQRGFYYPDLTDTSQYRVTFDLGLTQKINSWLSWQTAISERYSSTPPLGTLRNDLLVTTGVGVSMGKH